MLVVNSVTTSNHIGLGDYHVLVFTDNAKALTDSMSLQTPCVCISQRVAAEPAALAFYGLLVKK